jgi:hypothetical protein
VSPASRYTCRAVGLAGAHRRLGAAGLSEHAQRGVDEPASDTLTPARAGDDQQLDEAGVGGVVQPGHERVAEQSDRHAVVLGQQHAGDR